MIRTARAQAVVEFALVIPLLMLLVAGIFDVSRVYVAYTVVASAAREAARSGAVNYPQAGWDTQAIQAGLNLAVGVDRTALTITPTQVATDPTRPYVRAVVTYNFHSITPLVGRLIGDPIQLTASAVVLEG